MIKLWSNIRAWVMHLLKKGVFARGQDVEPAFPAERIQAIQAFLKSKGLWGILVPHNDEFLNEYLLPHTERLQWLTGFTGSGGSCIITENEAFLFVDGRYTIQAKQQVCPHGVEVIQSFSDGRKNIICDWLLENMPQDEELAYCPWLHTISEIQEYEGIMRYRDRRLSPIEPHPIDTLWKDRPSLPEAAIDVHPIAYSGQCSKEKRQLVSQAIQPADMIVVIGGDAIAWLLNIRSHSVPFLPVPPAYAICYNDGTVDLFIQDSQNLSDDVKEHLGEEVSVFSLSQFEAQLFKQSIGKKVSLDPKETPSAVRFLLKHADLLYQENPCSLPRALKNPVEIKNIVTAHQADGVALTKFLYWLAHIPLDGSETEISAAKKLQNFREQNPCLKGPSFRTISAHGSNGAIIHYVPSVHSNHPLLGPSLYLVDSGGQYLNGGTTDVTRTVCLGGATDAQKELFTRVLKGHIDLAKIIFPYNTRGIHLDVLARRALWAVGEDYAHGTGHGVGSYLSVHEGPIAISKRSNPTNLQPGMVLSNEPGCYREGEYGIRLENLMVAQEVQTPFARSMLGFKSLTLAPFDMTLVISELLTHEQKIWLNGYHQYVYDSLMPDLEDPVRLWLYQQTRPV